MSDDAYTKPSVYKSGCEHRYACKCDTPYWLRESTPSEKAKEQRIKSPWEVVSCVNSESSKLSSVDPAKEREPVSESSAT